LLTGAAAGAGILLRSPAVGATGDPVTEMTLFDAIAGRRSVRRFRPDPVPREDIERIIKAACLAPTSGNQQPWRFLVVDDRARIDALRDACIEHGLDRTREQGVSDEAGLDAARERLAARYDPYLSAPVYVVVLTVDRSRYPSYNEKDGSLAAGYLMLAARALGYGSVFCTDSIPEEVTRAVFGIPEDMTRICITPIGVPEDWPRRPSKKPWRYFVKWNSL
jgi:5,6-dimethylbenzimidazole synthase